MTYTSIHAKISNEKCRTSGRSLIRGRWPRLGSYQYYQYLNEFRWQLSSSATEGVNDMPKACLDSIWCCGNMFFFAYLHILFTTLFVVFSFSWRHRQYKGDKKIRGQVILVLSQETCGLQYLLNLFISFNKASSSLFYFTYGAWSFLLS